MPLFWMTTSAMRVSPGASGEAGEAERRDEHLIAWRGGCAFFFEGEDVDVEDALAVRAVLEEGGELLRPARHICSTAGMRVLPPSQRWETSLPSLAPGSVAAGGQRLREPCGRSGRWRPSLCGRRAAATAW